VSFGTKDYNLKEQLKKLMQKDSLVKMLVEVDMISMFMHMEEQEHIFVEKNLLLLNHSKENQVDQD
jgi:hypothetical protein